MIGIHMHAEIMSHWYLHLSWFGILPRDNDVGDGRIGFKEFSISSICKSRPISRIESSRRPFMPQYRDGIDRSFLTPMHDTPITHRELMTKISRSATVVPYVVAIAGGVC